MTKLSKSRIANTLNIKVYRCEILFIREEILSVGLPPVRFSMCANDVSAADSSVSLYFSRFSHLFRRFFIPLRPVVVIQYFSLLFKRESGWNPEQCPLL